MPDPIDPTRHVLACARGRRFAAILLLVAVGIAMAGCRPQARDAAATINIALAFDPSPPSTGECGLSLALTDAAGRPLHVTHLAVEGDMNHAGMRPAFAQLTETAPGRYRGKIEFTMGGDWFLLVSGELPGGGRFEKRLDIPGVKTR